MPDGVGAVLHPSSNHSPPTPSGILVTFVSVLIVLALAGIAIALDRSSRK